MKLSLKNGDKIVQSWSCVAVENNGRLVGDKNSPYSIALKDVYNFNGEIKERPLSASVAIGVILLIIAVVGAVLFTCFFSLPYYLNIIIPVVLVFIGVLCIVLGFKKRKKYLELTLYAHQVKDDLIRLYLDKKGAQFSYLNSFDFHFEIEFKDANSIISQLGSVFALYDPRKNNSNGANMLQPFGFGGFPFPGLAFPYGGFSTQNVHFNPYVLVIENES